MLHRPFGDLKHFVREGLPKDAPKLLIVAPMSGHYATLLRGTVERMVENSEVFITDWKDARDVPLSDGTFDLDDYIDYLIEFCEHIDADSDNGVHMLAVCQPSVPALAATALMNADGQSRRTQNTHHDGRTDRYAAVARPRSTIWRWTGRLPGSNRL